MRTPRRVTAAQVKELRRQLNQGASLRTAAMRANMDRKSARKYRNLGQLPDEARKPHTWRTRSDPLADVWPLVAEQLKEAQQRVNELQAAGTAMNSPEARRAVNRLITLIRGASPDELAAFDAWKKSPKDAPGPG